MSCTHAGVVSGAECPWCRIDELEAELNGIRDHRGTPLAISDALWEFAEKRCGHNPISAKHALTSVIERVDTLEQALRETARMLHDAAEYRDSTSDYMSLVADKWKSQAGKALKIAGCEK